MAYQREPSRRKWQEAVKALKQILSNTNNTVANRLRAIELLCCVMGISAPETKRDRMVIRDLVQTHQMERSVIKAVDAKIAQEDSDKLVQAQADADAAAVAHTSAVFDSLLSGDGDVD
jgi:hypothetical protein